MRKGAQPNVQKVYKRDPKLGKTEKSSMIHSELKGCLCTAHPKHASNISQLV